MDTTPPLRGTGLTTGQMLEAPHKAVYVWCNSATHYPTELARALGRADLEVVRLSWLAFQNVAGRRFAGVVVDHDARLEHDAHCSLEHLAKRGMPVHLFHRAATETTVVRWCISEERTGLPLEMAEAATAEDACLSCAAALRVHRASLIPLRWRITRGSQTLLQGSVASAAKP